MSIEPMSEQDRVSLIEHYERIIIMEGRLSTLEAQIASMTNAVQLAAEDAKRRDDALDGVLKERFHQIDNLRDEVMEDRAQYARKDITRVINVLYMVALLAIAAYSIFK